MSTCNALSCPAPPRKKILLPRPKQKLCHVHPWVCTDKSYTEWSSFHFPLWGRVESSEADWKSVGKKQQQGGETMPTHNRSDFWTSRFCWTFLSKWSSCRRGVMASIFGVQYVSLLFSQTSYWDLSWHGTYIFALHNNQRVLNKTNNPGGKDENLPAATTDNEHKWEGFWATASIFQVSSVPLVLYT